MRRWNFLLPALALALTLCACGPGGEQPSTSPPEAPSQGAEPSNTGRTVPPWSELDWSNHLELDYASWTRCRRARRRMW